MKIYDCTTFYSEHMMMDIRFGILDKYVEKFIVTESTYSHKGIVFYNHFVDQTNQNKWNYNYKLKKINNELLPRYLLNNEYKFEEWFQN